MLDTFVCIRDGVRPRFVLPPSLHLLTPPCLLQYRAQSAICACCTSPFPASPQWLRRKKSERWMAGGGRCHENPGLCNLWTCSAWLWERGSSHHIASHHVARRARICAQEHLCSHVAPMHEPAVVFFFSCRCNNFHVNGGVTQSFSHFFFLRSFFFICQFHSPELVGVRPSHLVTVWGCREQTEALLL